MKLLVCLFLFLTPTFNLNYKKMTMPYSIVISKADLIVDGTVSKVFKNSYEFTISQFVKGKSGSKINVSIWKEWMCDPRIGELKTGQRLILFLEKTPSGNYNPINERRVWKIIINDSGGKISYNCLLYTSPSPRD